jgi:hypothetical protein
MGNQLASLGVGGGGGGSPVVLLRDTFTDADGTNLSSHSMDTGPGWTHVAGTITTQGNQASCTDIPGFYTADSTASDVTLTMAFNVGTLSGVQIAEVSVRGSDGSNYWLGTAWNNGDLILYQVNGGTFTQVASGTWAADASGHTLTLTASGQTVSVQVDNGTPVSYTDSFNQSATQCGLRLYAGSGTPVTADAFQVTTP